MKFPIVKPSPFPILIPSGPNYLPQDPAIFMFYSETLTNEQFIDRIGEKRTLVNNILRRKANRIGHILRRNCLLHDAIEGQMTEVKGVGIRIKTQILDDLRNRGRY